MGILRLLLLIVCVIVPSVSWADGYHWARPGGTATNWANCRTATETPPADDNASYCTRATWNANAVAGDIVYFRGGTYNVSGVTIIIPANSGTGDGTGRIVFSAYPGETPVFLEGAVDCQGMDINSKNWIKVTGITFHEFSSNSWIRGTASYNEVSYCSFYNTTNLNSAGRLFVIGYNAVEPFTDWSTHNWFHHNYLARSANTSSCNEGIDLLRIGMDESPPGDSSTSEDNYNTVEYNYFESAGHATLVNYGKYNVIRGNIAHNEPWISGCTSYDGTMPDPGGFTRGTTSTDSHSFTTGSKNLTVATGMSATYWTGTKPVAMFRSSDWDKIMWGTITSYDTDTGALVIDITSVKSGVSGGPYTDWILSQRNIPYYTNPAYNGLYSHRNFGIGDFGIRVSTYVLVEGNRLGFAGVNPNNNGADNLDFTSSKNIARYNFTYGAMASGILFKYAVGAPSYSGGCLNYVYNNTSYANGTGYDFTSYSSGTVNVSNGQGIAQGPSSGGSEGAHTDNVIKNNLVYGNGRGDICYFGETDPRCTPWHGDSVGSNWTTYGEGQGDPIFDNATLSDVTSQNLFPSLHGYTTTPKPNLSLSSSSPVINQGTYLALAKGAGSDNTTLYLDDNDSNYFQDGTWGSDLTRTDGTMQADWIAIGTVANVVQISSIDYATNTITLAEPKSWADNAPIWLYKKSDGTRVLYGAAPDYGAYEYNSETSPTTACFWCNK